MLVCLFDCLYLRTTPRADTTNPQQSIMRKEVGSMALDELMHNRASLNSAICMGMAGLEESWGIKVTRYEVQNIEVDKSTEESMAKQSAAERNRRVSAVHALHAFARVLPLTPLIPPLRSGYGPHKRRRTNVSREQVGGTTRFCHQQLRG